MHSRQILQVCYFWRAAIKEVSLKSLAKSKTVFFLKGEQNTGV